MWVGLLYTIHMCGRFALSSPKKLPKRYKTKNKLPLFEPSYNIAPGSTLPTITKNSPSKITMMRWGLKWKKDNIPGVINIRSETTKEKLYFEKLLCTKRCIIPTTGFYEWKKYQVDGIEQKQPYYFFIKNADIFSLAGIYNMFKDAEGLPYFTFAILTCPPSVQMKPVHNRMPVILQEKDEEAWLDPENNEFDNLYKLLKPLSGKNLKFHKVSKEVNSPKNDGSNLIKEI